MEATFRASCMLATKVRNEMLTASRDEEPTALITAARGRQEALLNGAPD